MLFKFNWFSYNLYMKLFHMLQTFHVLYQVIFKGYFKNLSFHLQQNVLWTDEMTLID